METAPTHVAVGRIVRPHGIRGEVAVFPLTAHEPRFAVGETLFLSATPGGEGPLTPVTIEASRLHQGRWLLQIEHVGNRTQAERFVGKYMVIPFRVAEAARQEGEFFLHALVGREVRTTDGRPLGRVVDVVETEGAMLLEIEDADRARKLLPFVHAFVREVGEHAIVVIPPAGWEDL